MTMSHKAYAFDWQAFELDLHGPAVAGDPQPARVSELA
jgi:hypothetical protein